MGAAPTQLYGKALPNLKMGEQLSRFEIKPFVGVENRTQRIGILSLADGDWYQLNTHYSNELKSYIACFQRSCCTIYGPAKARYIIPVVEYRDVNMGGEVLSRSCSIYFLALGYKHYKLISNINAYCLLTEVDLWVNSTKVNAKTFTYTEPSFSVAGRDGRPTKAVWKSDPDFMQAVWNEFQRVKPDMMKAAVSVMGATAEEAEAKLQRTLENTQRSDNRQPGAASGGASTAFTPPVSGFDAQRYAPPR